MEAKLVIQQSYQDSWRWSFSTLREKNVNTLTELEMTLEDVKKEILSLSVLDYCSGPTKDPEIKGDLWIFGKIIRGKEVYIKLKLSGDQHGRMVRVLSFHIAGKPLTYYFAR
ncbi:MAG: toxin [Dehalococcoidia bacterium]|nr:toxin [Dehalococcoidia bacterium]